MSFWSSIKSTLQTTLSETSDELSSTWNELRGEANTLLSSAHATPEQDSTHNTTLIRTLNTLFAPSDTTTTTTTTTAQQPNLLRLEPIHTSPIQSIDEWQFDALTHQIPSYMQYIRSAEPIAPSHQSPAPLLVHIDSNVILSEDQWMCAEDFLRSLPALARARARCVPSSLYPKDEPFLATFFVTLKKCLQLKDKHTWEDQYISVFEARKQHHAQHNATQKAQRDQNAIDTDHLNELLLNIKDDALRLSNQLNTLMGTTNPSEQKVAQLHAHAQTSMENKKHLAQIIAEIQHGAQDHTLLNNCISINKQLESILRKYASFEGNHVELEDQPRTGVEPQTTEEDDDERAMPWDEDADDEPTS